MIVGTWIVDEVRAPVQKGYVVVKVFEFWEYIVERYKDGSGGLFTEYINMSLKLKQEASGYPVWV